MARKYELKKRAERQAETRRRIVDAAIELHTTIGPAGTTVSAIAERAGVQRHTVYAHFPTESDVMEACSGHYMAEHPLPDPAAWRAIADPWPRLETALAELYAWYAENRAMLVNVMRDREVHEPTREVTERRMGAWGGDAWTALADGLPPDGATAALLALALEFGTWRSLAGNGVPPADAGRLMAAAVRAVAAGAPAASG
jgi:AcrR family transcriptional regulator